MVLLFFEYFFTIILILGLSYILGRILCPFSKDNYDNNFHKFFLRTCTGLFLLVLCIALYYTKVNTILLFALIPLGYLVTIKKFNLFKPWHAISKIEVIIFFETFAVIGVLLLFRFMFFVDGYGLAVNLYQDVAFYGKLGQYLKTTGIESTSLEYLFPTNVSPYHYFDIWLITLSGIIYGMINPSMVTGITYTILATISYLGFKSIFFNYKRTGFESTLVSLGLIGISAIYLPFFDKVFFLKYSSTFASSPMGLPKLFVILILFQIITNELLEKNYQHAYILFLLLPILYFTTAPSILSINFIVGIVLVNYATTKSRSTWIKLTILTILTGLSITLFYFFRNDSNNSLSDSALYSFLLQIGELQYYLTLINIFVGTSIKIMMLYLPLFVSLAYYLFKSKYQGLLNKSQEEIVFIFFLPFGLLAAGTFFWALLHNSITTVQFFSNISVPLISIIICVVYCEIRSIKSNYVHRLSSFVIIAWIGLSWTRLILSNYSQKQAIENSYDPTFVRAYNEILNDKKPIGVFLKSDEDYQIAGLHNIIESTYSLDIRLQNYKYESNKHTVSISSLNINPNYYKGKEDFAEDIRDNSTFARYVKAQKEHGVFKNINRSQLDFAKKFEIDHMLTTFQLHEENLLLNYFDLTVANEQETIFLYLKNNRKRL